ncbi:unnamed protein product [Pseudo-nitzschia multistriata]|uniref:EGF-like domain-containing protein n=1 Tax=Pseudo-nitzschia multistriata TaxID=183589 RepID=A0A448Z4H8_9STRA|nr:unnamed protein product [Pseudo-nitzschia multistriata]
MFVTKKFALFIVSAAFLASSVSAGGVRGVPTEDSAPANHGWGRELKKDQNKPNKNQNNPAVVTRPALPPPPTSPPVPNPIDVLVGKCSNPTLTSCILRNGANERVCFTCLYSISRLSSAGDSAVANCGRSQCGGCVNEARDTFGCATGGSAPAPVTTPGVPAPVSVSSPVPAPVPALVPAPVPAPVLEEIETFDFTTQGCPALKPVSGAVCSVPAPFQFQQCDYPTGSGVGVRCMCAYGQFICNPAAISPTPAPVPAPTAPTPPVAAPPGVCSPTLPNSGDTCSTGGAPFVTCCYTGISNKPANYAHICNCLSGENRYICNGGVSSQCTSVINAVASSPVPVPVPAPVPAPIATMPTPSLVNAPAPTGSSSSIPEFCRALPGVPKDGESCAGVLPAGMASGGCGGEIIETDNMNVTTVTNAACTCTATDPAPAWSCVKISAIAPPSSGCPPQASPPNTGDSCATVLPADSFLTSVECKYSKTVTDSSQLSTTTEKFCTCEKATQIFTCTDTESQLIPPVSIEAPADPAPADPAPADPAPADPAPADPAAPAASSPTIVQDGCPSTITSGTPCKAFIPAGANEQSCMTSLTTQCDCPGQESADPVWTCRTVP